MGITGKALPDGATQFTSKDGLRKATLTQTTGGWWVQMGEMAQRYETRKDAIERIEYLLTTH